MAELKLSAVKAKYLADYAAALQGVKRDVETKLKELVALFSDLEEADKKVVIEEPALEPLLASIGLSATQKNQAVAPKSKKPKKPWTPSKDKDKELVKDIVAFVDKVSKSQGDVDKKFKMGNVKTGKLRDYLVKEKLITVTADGNKKVWSAAKSK